MSWYDQEPCGRCGKPLGSTRKRYGDRPWQHNGGPCPWRPFKAWRARLAWQPLAEFRQVEKDLGLPEYDFERVAQ